MARPQPRSLADIETIFAAFRRQGFSKQKVLCLIDEWKPREMKSEHLHANVYAFIAFKTALANSLRGGTKIFFEEPDFVI